MDGTLIDTEPYWVEAEYRLVERYGGRWSQEHAHALVGNPLLVSAEYIRANSPVTMPAQQVVEYLMGHVVHRVGERAPWRPGAVELLNALGDAGVPCALVTMSWQPLADAVLGQLPQGTFTAVVTGDQVARGKPDPEAYLTAVQRLGVRAEHCLAIEDSDTGASSAVAAGVPTLVVPHLVPVPGGPGRVTRDTLSGLSPAGLAGLRDAVG